MANRIKSLASLIPNNSVVADIGCDHAYLLIELLKNNSINFGYGIDNKEGPIKNAINNLSKYQFDNYEIIKANGLDFNAKKDIDVLIFAGIGGLNTIEIISKKLDKLKMVKYIVTDIHRDDNKVKQYLSTLDYKVDKAIDIIDKKKNYHLVRYIRS